MSRRFTLRVEGERHGFVNMLSDMMTRTEPARFVASRVRHPTSTFGEVIVDASCDADARDAIARACDRLVEDCDDLLASLGMSDEAPPHLAAVAMPDVILDEANAPAPTAPSE